MKKSLQDHPGTAIWKRSGMNDHEPLETGRFRSFMAGGAGTSNTFLILFFLPIIKYCIAQIQEIFLAESLKYTQIEVGPQPAALRRGGAAEFVITEKKKE
jgi:hypothetical protein